MTERDDAVLAAALEDLGRALAAPAADLAPGVARRIAAPAPRAGRAAMRRALALGAAAAVVALGAVVAVSPEARRAVAGWLGVDGIRIRFGDRPAPPSPPAGAALELGERTSLAAAEAEAGFDVVVPGALGPPDAVYLDDAVGDGLVSLVYRPRPGLPRAVGTDAGAIVTQLRAHVDRMTLEKVVHGGGVVEPVTIGSGRGFWISGPLHAVVYRDRYGRVLEERTRAAGDVLLWQRDDVSLRLESALPRRAAIAVAESMR